MTYVKTLFLMLISFQLISGVNEMQAKEQMKPIDLKNFDKSAKPQDDFFRYSNGTWMKNNPVPNAYSIWGSFNILQEDNNEKLSTLMQDIAKNPGKPGSERRKIADYYNVAMDSAKANQLGYKPIAAQLDKIDKIKDKNDLVKMIAELHSTSSNPLFGFYAGQDDKNSSIVIAQVAQGGLGMGNRDYYTDDNDRAKMLREKYEQYMGKMCKLAGLNNTEDLAKRVMELEVKLANTSMTMTEQRDPKAVYNPMSVDELQKLSTAIDWKLYFKGLGIPTPKKVNVTSMKFFKGIPEIINTTDLQTWKDYLKWNVINDAASYLSSDFVDLRFDFYGKTFSGSKEIQPRWKRALNSTSGALGEAIGKEYCDKYFPPQAKTRMLELVGNLRWAFDQHIQNLDWMSDVTKAKAREKLKDINVKIGYPNKWKSYAKMKVSADNSYYENAIEANKFEMAEMLKEIDKKYDTEKWHMTPQTVNAYYSPNSNEIVFPAAILQPPFFFLDGDDAVNYGGIGAVIGHEMTHGFDDQGREYDKYGNMNNWWTDEDAKKFEAKTEVLVKQFDNFELLGEKVNGRMTLGENIADLGGITLAHTALMKTLKGKKVEEIDGFTPEQRLLLSWSQVWRANVREEELKKRLKDDVHSPAEARVNGLMPNLPFFHKAFNTKPGDALYRSEADRAVIW